MIIRLLFLFVFFVPTVAGAQADKMLTAENVQSFYDALKDVQFTKDPKVFEEFYDKHLRDDMQMTFVVKKYVPGREMEDEFLDLDKKGTIERTAKVNSSGAIRSVDLTIEDLKIDDTGKNAIAKRTMEGHFVYDAQEPDAEGYVDVTMSVVCDDALSLSDDNVVQINMSSCVLTGSMKTVDGSEP